MKKHQIDRIFAVKNLDAQTFKDCFVWHESLSTLRIGEIVIQVIEPEAFVWFKNLKSLKLKCIGLTRIEPGAFEGLTSLEQLDLRDNYLEDLEPATFDESLSGLVELDLSNNHFTRLEPNLFKSLTNLKSLSLNGNELSVDLHEDVFSGLDELETLNLIRNPIAQVVNLESPIIVKHLKKIKDLYL